MPATRPGKAWHPLLALVLLALAASLPTGARTFKQEVLEPDPALTTQGPSVLWVRLPVSGQPCTAVAVGPRVLLTAAHCVEDGEIKILTPDPRTLDCWVPEGEHPKPAGCESPIASDAADLAACYFPAGFKKGIETVSNDLAHLAKGTEVRLTGLGCVSATEDCKPKDWSSKPERGVARILETASADDLLFLTIGDLENGESALCFGDSGGPVSVESEGGRLVVGIAQGGCVDCDRSKSAITSLAATATVKWLCKWMEEKPKKRAIQGLTCT